MAEFNNYYAVFMDGSLIPIDLLTLLRIINISNIYCMNILMMKDIAGLEI